ncbi:hypothetical protein [Pseudomonas mohnii]
MAKLLDEAVLWLSRYLLLLKLGPAAIRVGYALDPSTIIRLADRVLPQILIQGMLARLNGASPANGLLGGLSSDAEAKLLGASFTGEIARMRSFAALGLWSDVPPVKNTLKVTNPYGQAISPQSEIIVEPYPPLSDDYLISMGPRVLWVLECMAPQVLKIGREISGFFSPTIHTNSSLRYVATHLQHRVELGPAEEMWVAPFTNDLVEGDCPAGVNYLPHSWQDFINLLSLVQAANLWVCLLATAGRIGEVMGLRAQCVQPRDNGMLYACGRTYKFSASIFGDERDWLAPEVLLNALKCQKDVVDVFYGLHQARKFNVASPMIDDLPLWLSFVNFQDGTGAVVQLGSPIYALAKMATQLGVNSKSDGLNAHPHRFRKTVAKLVGIALVDGPKVLMRLLGHKDISVAIEYILSDKSIQAEVDKVARELRVMRCKDVLLEIHREVRSEHDAVASCGGGAVPEIKKAIVEHEAKLAALGLSWDDSSAYDLAKLMTFNGQYYRYLKKGVVCTKVVHKIERCVCNSDCIHRVEEGTARRDAIILLPLLLADATRALEEGNLLVASGIMGQFHQESERFSDISDQWRFDDRVIKLNEALLG